MNTEATHDQNAPLSAGQRLRNAREQLGLSQQTVAERLCLKVSTVRQIEEDNLPSDLAATFLRGYIRSYARIVHIPEEELLPAVKKEEPFRPAKVNTVQGMPLGKRRKKRDGWLWSFTFLVLFVVIGLTGTWWWQNHKAQQDEITSMADDSSARLNADNSQPVDLNNTDSNTGGDIALSTPADVPSTPEPTTQDIASSPLTPPAPEQNNVVSPSQMPDVSAQNDPAAAIVSQAPSETETQMASDPGETPQTPVDNNALVMNFNADCWLEVIDATGKTLFSGMQRKDGHLNLTGQAPYRLKIGAPAAVEIQYQGKTVDLSRFIRASQVARLTLNADESAAE